MAQDEIRVEQYLKQVDGQWALTETRAFDGTIELHSIDCRLALGDIYDKVPFD